MSSRHKTFVTHKAVSIHVIYSIHIYIYYIAIMLQDNKKTAIMCAVNMGEAAAETYR